MPNMSPKKAPMPTQEPNVRNKNFLEVATGYTEEVAIEEAQRCLNCKHKPCVSGCPVHISIPDFSRTETLSNCCISCFAFKVKASFNDHLERPKEAA